MYLYINTNDSEEQTASIFRVSDSMFLRYDDIYQELHTTSLPRDQHRDLHCHESHNTLSLIQYTSLDIKAIN